MMIEIINAICVLTMLVLWVICIIYHENSWVILNKAYSPNSRKKIKLYVKGIKKYKWIAIPANTISVLASVCLGGIIAYTIIINIFVLFVAFATLGMIELMAPNFCDDMLESLKYGTAMFPYILYILSYATSIKIIFFNAQLQKLLCTKKICTNCGDEATGNFCGNCGNKIN